MNARNWIAADWLGTPNEAIEKTNDTVMPAGVADRTTPLR